MARSTGQVVLAVIAIYAVLVALAAMARPADSPGTVPAAAPICFTLAVGFLTLTAPGRRTP